MRFRDLMAHRDHMTSVELRTRTMDYSVDIDRWRGRTHVMLFGTRRLEPGHPAPEAGECGAIAVISSERFCRGLDATFRAGIDRVRLEVPPRCLRQPRWVRVSSSSYGASGDTSLYDHWRPGSSAWTARFGPRVKSS